MDRTSLSRSRLAGVACSIAVVATAVIPAAAQAGTPDPPQLTITAKADITGIPKTYHFELVASPTFIPSNMLIRFSRRASTGNHPEQAHEYDIAGTDLSCNNGLGQCTLTDAGNMGAFGEVDMDFQATADAKTHQVLCDDGTTVAATVTTRKGLLGGRLRLKTGTGYFGTIRNGGGGAHIPASVHTTIEKYAPKNDCPAPTGMDACQLGLRFFALGTPNSSFGERVPGDPQARLGVFVDTDSGDPNVSIQHSVSGLVPRSALRVTSNSPSELEKAKIDYGGLAPFATGQAKFTGSGLPEVQVGTCRIVNRDGTLDADVDVQFDGFGTVHYTGGDAFFQKVTPGGP